MQCIAAQRNAQYRGDYVAEILMHNVNMFVFADETGKDKRDSLRRYGYAVQGTTPQSRLQLSRGDRISNIAAISCTGLVGFDTYTEMYGVRIFLILCEELLYPI